MKNLTTVKSVGAWLSYHVWCFSVYFKCLMIKMKKVK